MMEIIDESLQLPATNLEETQEFKAWRDAKLSECVRYVKLSFGEDLPIEKLTFRSVDDGYPDPILQQRGHAQIWGYNYKDKEGNIILNPATKQLMSYVVWKSLIPDSLPKDTQINLE